MIFCLKGVRAPSTKAPMMTMPPAALTIGGAARVATSVEPMARRALVLRSLRRFSLRCSKSRVFILVSSLSYIPMHDCRGRGIEEAGVIGVEADADGRADRGAEPTSRPRRQLLLAEADHHQRLVAHRLDHIDLAIEGRGGAGGAEQDVLRPYADLADGLAGAGGAA